MDTLWVNGDTVAHHLLGEPSDVEPGSGTGCPPRTQDLTEPEILVSRSLRPCLFQNRDHCMSSLIGCLALKEGWSPRADSNRRPSPYQGNALTAAFRERTPANGSRADRCECPGQPTNKATRARGPVDLANEHLSIAIGLCRADHGLSFGGYTARAGVDEMGCRRNASFAASFQCRLAP